MGKIKPGDGYGFGSRLIVNGPEIKAKERSTGKTFYWKWVPCANCGSLCWQKYHARWPLFCTDCHPMTQVTDGSGSGDGSG